MEENAAYRLLRDQATSERVAMSAIAEDIGAGHETMAQLGLNRRTDSTLPNT